MDTTQISAVQVVLMLLPWAGVLWLNWRRIEDRESLRKEFSDQLSECQGATHRGFESVMDSLARLAPRLHEHDQYASCIHMHEAPVVPEHHGAGHPPRMKGVTRQNINGEVWRTEQCQECGALELHEVN